MNSKLELVIQEVLDIESLYVTKLRIVVDVFINPLKQRLLINDAIINEHEIQIHFSCWEVLCAYHSEFYSKLVESQRIGRLVDEIESRRLVPQCEGRYLEMFLIEPLRQLPRYEDLLTKILKYMAQGSRELTRQSISQSLIKLSNIKTENDKAFIKVENRLLMMKIMQSVDPSTRINLLDDPERKLLKFGDIQVLHSIAGLTSYRFWLFSDLLVYGKPISVSTSLNQPNTSTLRLTRKVSMGSVDSNGSNGSNNGMYNPTVNVVAPNVIYSLNLPELEIINCKVTKKSDGPAFKILYNQEEVLLLAQTTEDKHSWIDAMNAAISEQKKLVKVNGGTLRSTRARTTSSNGSAGGGFQACELCHNNFSKTNKKEMCLNCGSDVCHECSSKSFLLTFVSPKNPSRVCNNCYVKLCMGAGEANISEPLPEQFLPAPPQVLLQKSIQKLNTKNCNICQIAYSNANNSLKSPTTCQNCYTTICGGCNQKKYDISYIDTNKPTKICETCYRLFTTGQGGDAFTLHIAGSSSDNPLNGRSTLSPRLTNSSKQITVREISVSKIEDVHSPRPNYAPPIVPQTLRSSRPISESTIHSQVPTMTSGSTVGTVGTTVKNGSAPPPPPPPPPTPS